MLVEYKDKVFYAEHKDHIGGVDQDVVVSWLKNNIKWGENYIEIGAHVGAIACFVCQVVKGKSLLFEPYFQTAEILEKNLQLNYVKNYEIIPNAVLDKVGKKDFYYGTQSNGNSFYNHTGPTIEVETTTIDEETWRLDNNPIVMKIDAEFSEPLIWKGMKKTLPRIRAVIMEFHYGGITLTGIDPLDFLREIEDDGFTVLGLHGRPWPETELVIGKKDLLLINNRF